HRRAPPLKPGRSQPCAIRAGGSLAPPLQRLFGLMAGYAGAAITLSLGLIRPRRPRSAAPRLFLSFCTTQFTDTRRPAASRPAVRVLRSRHKSPPAVCYQHLLRAIDFTVNSFRGSVARTRNLYVAATHRLRLFRLPPAIRIPRARPGRLRRWSAARRRPSRAADSGIHRGRLVAWHARAMARAHRVQAVLVGNRSQRRMYATQGGTGRMARGKNRARIRPARHNHRAQPRRRPWTRNRDG